MSYAAAPPPVLPNEAGTLDSLPDPLMMIIISFLSPISEVELCCYGGGYEANDYGEIHYEVDDSDESPWMVGWSDGGHIAVWPAFVAEGRYVLRILSQGGGQSHRWLVAKPLWNDDKASLLWRSPSPIRRVDPRRLAPRHPRHVDIPSYLRSQQHVPTTRSRARTYDFPLKLRGYFKKSSFYCTDDPTPTRGHPLNTVDTDENAHVLDVVPDVDPGSGISHIELTSPACRLGHAYRTEVGSRLNLSAFHYPIVPPWSHRVQPMLRKRIFAVLHENAPGSLISDDEPPETDWAGYWLYAPHRVLRSEEAVDDAVEQLTKHICRSVGELWDQIREHYNNRDEFCPPFSITHLF